MSVVEDDDNRRAPGNESKVLKHRNKPSKAVMRVSGLGTEHVIECAELSEDRHPRPERWGIAVMPAAAYGDPRAAFPGADGEFLGEPGLAEPYCTADDYQPAVAPRGVGEPAKKQAQLSGATDKRRRARAEPRPSRVAHELFRTFHTVAHQRHASISASAPGYIAQ